LLAGLKAHDFSREHVMLSELVGEET